MKLHSDARLMPVAHLNTNYRHFLLFVDQVSSCPMLGNGNSSHPLVQARRQEGAPAAGRIQQNHPPGESMKLLTFSVLPYVLEPFSLLDASSNV